MKAFTQDRYGPPDVLHLADVPKPTPGDDDVIVRVHAASLDPGAWHLVAGMPYLVRLMGFGLRRPKSRVRADLAGSVEAVGKNVSTFKPGDEVFGVLPGGFAEYARGPAAMLVHKPANITFEEAAAVATSGHSAVQAVRDYAKVRAGQHVLVIGAGGGVGTFVVQLCKLYDAQVTGVCSGAKADLVRSIGAEEVIDYTREDFTTQGRTYDVIIDTAGRRPLAQLRKALAPTGTLVLVGGEGGGRWLGGIQRGWAAAALSPFVNQRLLAPFMTERPEDLEFLRQQLEAGTLKPVIGRTYPLEELPEAMGYLHQGHAAGKIVVTV